jgi:hypothetical protein
MGNNYIKYWDNDTPVPEGYCCIEPSFFKPPGHLRDGTVVPTLESSSDCRHIDTCPEAALV